MECNLDKKNPRNISAKVQHFEYSQLQLLNLPKTKSD